MSKNNRSPKFGLGDIHITAAAYRLFQKDGVRVDMMMRRHSRGNWGLVSITSAMNNADAVINGGRIVSVYSVSGAIIWIVTDLFIKTHKSNTYVILPQEYTNAVPATAPTDT